jgi:hypothetical protein
VNTIRRSDNRVSDELRQTFKENNFSVPDPIREAYYPLGGYSYPSHSGIVYPADATREGNDSFAYDSLIKVIEEVTVL